MPDREVASSGGDEKYYAEGAFDSTKPRELPEVDPSKVDSWMVKEKRRGLAPWGIYFGDFTTFAYAEDIKLLKAEKGRTEDLVIEVGTWRNPYFFVGTVRSLSVWFMVIALVFDAILYWVVATGFGAEGRITVLLINAIPLFTFLVCSILLRYVPNRNNVVLSRRSGMVWMPKMGKYPAEEIPFDEFDAYVRLFVDPRAGAYRYILHLAHRYSRRGVEPAQLLA